MTHKFEIHITTDRISVERISEVAKSMAFLGFRTGDLVLHLNSFDKDKADSAKSFFTAQAATKDHAMAVMDSGLNCLYAHNISYTRRKIEEIILDYRSA